VRAILHTTVSFFSITAASFSPNNFLIVYFNFLVYCLYPELPTCLWSFKLVPLNKEKLKKSHFYAVLNADVSVNSKSFAFSAALLGGNIFFGLFLPIRIIKDLSIFKIPSLSNFKKNTHLAPCIPQPKK